MKVKCAVFWHPCENAPFQADYQRLTTRCLKMAAAQGMEPWHLCLPGAPEVPGASRFEFQNGKPEELMHARMQTQVEFMRFHSAPSGIWFLDPDAVPQAWLPPIDAGMAVTRREGMYDCYNGGVIYVGRNGSAIFEACLQEYGRMEPDNVEGPPFLMDTPHPKMWMGDQRAIRDVLGDLPVGVHDIGRVDGELVAVLDEHWNHVPTEGAERGPLVVHYKGNLKRGL